VPGGRIYHKANVSGIGAAPTEKIKPCKWLRSTEGCINPEPMREAVVIEEIKNGNRKELADIYKAHRNEFVNWASHQYQCTSEEARDIYQATIITFYDNIIKEKLLHLNGTVKTYLFAIGKNKIMELRRADKKFATNTTAAHLEIADRPDEDRERKELRLQVMQVCLEKLGEPCKTMLELYYYHHSSLEELAEKLHYKNSDTIKNLKSRCLARLRNLVTIEMEKHKV
jgi:RNA polymerase sigma factor (sigma-70 family)